MQFKSLFILIKYHNRVILPRWQFKNSPMKALFSMCYGRALCLVSPSPLFPLSLLLLATLLNQSETLLPIKSHGNRCNWMFLFELNSVIYAWSLKEQSAYTNSAFFSRKLFKNNCNKRNHVSS